MTGLYPEASKPIPVATASDMDEIMFANVLSCERLADVMKRARYELRRKSLPQQGMLALCVFLTCTRIACNTEVQTKHRCCLVASSRSRPLCCQKLVDLDQAWRHEVYDIACVT